MAAAGQNRRWSVAYGGYPDGWDMPFCMTNDPYVAMQSYDEASPGRMQTVAIFDDNGEGEPLDPHAVEEILDREYERAEANTRSGL